MYLNEINRENMHSCKNVQKYEFTVKYEKICTFSFNLSSQLCSETKDVESK